jgi:hypothetical protein
MRIALNIVGVGLLLLGSIWLLQGIDVLRGSFMSGQTRWALSGAFLIVAAIAFFMRANRKRKTPV